MRPGQRSRRSRFVPGSTLVKHRRPCNFAIVIYAPSSVRFTEFATPAMTIANSMTFK